MPVYDRVTIWEAGGAGAGVGAGTIGAGAGCTGGGGAGCSAAGGGAGCSVMGAVAEARGRRLYVRWKSRAGGAGAAAGGGGAAGGLARALAMPSFFLAGNFQDEAGTSPFMHFCIFYCLKD